MTAMRFSAWPNVSLRASFLSADGEAELLAEPPECPQRDSRQGVKHGDCRKEGAREIEGGCPYDAATGGIHQGTGTRRLSRHAPDPALRREGRPALRHGLYRRLLSPL